MILPDTSAPPNTDEVPDTLAGWLALRGDQLTAAMQKAAWFPWPDDTFGGWCVMPYDVSPSMGVPAVTMMCLTENLARQIADDHNRAIRPQAATR